MSYKALVTGGTRGIGGAIASRLIADGFDCTITGTGPDKPSHVADSASYLAADFGKRKDVEFVCKHVSAGQYDVIVNNVGINIKGDSIEYAPDDFDRMVDVNLRSAFRLCQSALGYMKLNSYGKIVNITSLWGVRGNPRNSVYCATKFGLDGLTTSLAPEFASHGVLINSVAPGYIMTEAAKEAFSDEALADVERYIPVGRLGQPSEVASLVSWLVSKENSYLTGQNIIIDGGLTRTAFP